MPSLGADMTEGTLYEWFFQPGDTVKRGDIIASVETHKGTIDVEVFEDGVIDQLLVEPGIEVPVGEVLAIIRAVGEKPATIATHAPPIKQAVGSPPSSEAHPMDQHAIMEMVKTKPKPATNGKRLRISPAARRLAAELGVDLHQLKGSGDGGVIKLEDVQAATVKVDPVSDSTIRVSPIARKLAEELNVDLSQVKGSGSRGAINRVDVEKAAAAKKPVVLKPVKLMAVQTPVKPKPKKDFQAGMRQAISAAMSRSNRDIPHYYLETRIDITHTLDWLETINLKRSIKDRILPAVLLIKAVAKALADVPALNGYWIDDAHQPQEGIHIGFAIALRQGGLITPAIHDADLKSLDELVAAMRDLIMRTRAGRLRSSEMTDSTVTLTNLGDLGVEKVFGVIYPPQVALVGFGKVVEDLWVENGMFGIRKVIIATLAGDHRATDGRVGAQFLDALGKYLKEPETL
ncbi:MAG: 2-oxo acid dehydrogenase subunit E2 [Chloroflexi bacterium]|nr:2-oxo acid dehydrogenase subunit E2 [Chloroflexota bacterium]